MRTMPATLTLLALLALSGPAHADGLLDWSVGVKGGGGGVGWLQPDMGTGAASDFGRGQDFFNEARAGWTYGGGVFAELRILKFLGVETGLFFFADVIKQDTTRRALGQVVAKTEERFELTTLRIPILVKGVLPLGIVRLWVGLGPEFSVPLTSSASSDVGALTINTRDETDIYLAAGLGVVIAIGPVAIPIDVRFGWNATQPSAYEDLVAIDAVGAGSAEVTLRTSNTIEGRLLVGLAYEF